jgi:hypothetical protein
MMLLICPVFEQVNKTELIDPNCVPFTITFSAQTSANMTQV